MKSTATPTRWTYQAFACSPYTGDILYSVSSYIGTREECVELASSHHGRNEAVIVEPMVDRPGPRQVPDWI